ncbi:hypothetical protein GW930_03200 [Candidatus Saccharibacteria bacterium]|nr:hypothetical protein [Candidatus Saccharibacteria bacterium]
MKVFFEKARRAAILSFAALLVLPLVAGAVNTPTAPAVSGDPEQPTISWTTVDSDPSGVLWEEATASAAFIGRAYASAIVFDNKMWVMGGVAGGAPGYLNDVWYSADGVNWTEATADAGWSPRSELAVTVFDNKMWVMGGWNAAAAPGGVRYNDVWYSSDGVSWTESTSSAAWSARGGAKVETFGSKMWLVGGSSGAVTYSDAWYSSDGVSWTEATGAAAFEERYQHGLVAFDNKLWVVGGSTNGSVYANDAWHSQDGINWTEATADAGWVGRAGFGLVVFDNKLWVNGGESEVNPSWLADDAWYSSDGINWTEATDSTASGDRGYHTSLAFDDKLWAISGYSGDSWNTNPDVWYTQNNSVEKYKLCWDTSSGGCANSVMVSASNGQVVGSLGEQGIVEKALGYLGILNTASAVGGEQLSYTLSSPLDSGTWYFSVAAVTYSGVESELSLVASVNVQDTNALPGAPNTGLVSKWSWGVTAAIALASVAGVTFALRLIKRIV